MKNTGVIDISIKDIDIVLKGLGDLHQTHFQFLPEYYISNNNLNKEDILKILNSDDKFLLKLPNQKITKGFIFCRKSITKGDIPTETIFIEAIYVLPQYRNKGVAIKLLSATEIFFNQQNIFNFSLNVWDFNTSALSLYKKMGFKPIRTYYIKNK